METLCVMSQCCTPAFLGFVGGIMTYGGLVQYFRERYENAGFPRDQIARERLLMAVGAIVAGGLTYGMSSLVNAACSG